MTLIVFNSTARYAKFLKKRIMGQLRLIGVDGHFVEVKEKGEAKKVIVSALKKDLKQVIAIGGDGLIHDIIQVIAKTNVALGIIPAGKTNLFAHMLGITNWKSGCLALKNGEITPIDLGLINDYYFLTSVDIESKRKEPKERFSLFSRKSAQRAIPATLEITHDNQLLTLQSNIYTVSISPHPFSQKNSDDAFLSDQMLHLMIKSIPGEGKKTPEVTILQGSEISISAKNAMVVTADGEEVGKTPVQTSVVPQGLLVIRAR